MSDHLNKLMGLLDFCLIMPHGVQPMGRVRSKPKGKPQLTVLGDDLYASQGPKVFPSALLKKVFRSATHVQIVASGPEQHLYDAAVDRAMNTGPCVIIETQPEHEKEWLSKVQKHSDATIMVISPTVKPSWVDSAVRGLLQ